MKTQKYIVTIEMPDGDMISSGWLKDLIQGDCDVEEEGRDKVSVEEVSTSEDLEAEIKRYIPRDQCPVPDFMEAVARHFANWQKEQMMKATAMVEGNVLELGETYKDLTISVEGKELNEALQPLGAKEGDRVRMIITIKEDKQ